MDGLKNLRPWCGKCRAGFSNTVGSPKSRKKAPCQKKIAENYVPKLDAAGHQLGNASSRTITEVKQR